MFIYGCRICSRGANWIFFVILQICNCTGCVRPPNDLIDVNKDRQIAQITDSKCTMLLCAAGLT